MEIKQSIIPEGRPNRPGRALKAGKITIHNTANTRKSADAEAHARYLVKTTEKKSWHFTCDDTEIYQHLPVNEIGYHAKNGNSKSVGLEICEHKGIDLEAAHELAAKLSAQLLRELKLVPNDVVTHRSWTGKNCPNRLLDNTAEGPKWEAFRARVKFHFEQKQEMPSGSIAFNPKSLSAPTLADDLIDLDHATITVG